MIVTAGPILTCVSSRSDNHINTGRHRQSQQRQEQPETQEQPGTKTYLGWH